MRTYFLLLTLLSFINAQGQQGESSVFKHYKCQYKDLIVYTIPDLGIRTRYRILGYKDGTWELIDYYRSEQLSSVYLDSIVKRAFPNHEWVLQTLIDNGLTTLSAESVLPPCVRREYAVVNGDSLFYGVQDLEAIQDLEVHSIEYSLQGKNGKVLYRGIREAERICPDSMERKRFRNIANAILLAGVTFQ